ncbi:MAG TPA: glycosyltransferase family 4 protein, partial [Solirubrobacteraceae bacterium]
PSLRAGGAERQASILLPGLRQRGIDAGIIALDGGGPFVAPLRAAGVPVEVLDMRHRFDLAPLARSPLIRSFKPDVIVSRGVSGLYVGHALSLWRRAAHLYNDHRGVGVELSQRRELMTKILAGRLRSVIVVSQDQADGWLEMGCSRETVVVIANGVPTERIAVSAGEVREELEIPQDAVVALLVASLRPLKRVPDFIRAVQQAREAHPELVALIAGDGPERVLLHQLADCDPSIRVLGYRDDVPRLLAAADVLVLASEYEALPMAILEAMAAGLPVLATRVGAIPAAVGDGESGLLVAPGDVNALRDGLVRLAGDPGLRQALGAAGQRRCSESWGAERMIDCYLRVMQAAVEPPR